LGLLEQYHQTLLYLVYWQELTYQHIGELLQRSRFVVCRDKQWAIEEIRRRADGYDCQ
jgi:DNA-directed RNA polymerase specialized sigma subunit